MKTVSVYDTYLTAVKLLFYPVVDVDGVRVGRQSLVHVSADQLAGRAVVQCFSDRWVHVLQTYDEQSTSQPHDRVTDTIRQATMQYKHTKLTSA